MRETITRVATWVAGMAFAALPLTPVLALLNLVSPCRLPWGYVLIPWIGAFHLVLCWTAGRMIARILVELLSLGRSRW